MSCTKCPCKFYQNNSKDEQDQFCYFCQHYSGAHNGPIGQHCIRFYEKHEPFYEFTNFYESPFEAGGVKWKTVEHFFQANKFAHITLREVILQLPVAELQGFVHLCRDLRNPTWKNASLYYMEKGLSIKFSNEDLCHALLQTAGSKIVYDDANKFWGTGGSAESRENKLGQLLEKIRNDQLAKSNLNKVSGSSVQTIVFKDDMFNVLSNWFPIKQNSNLWNAPSVEHFYQMTKFDPTVTLSEVVRLLPTPREAFQFARDFSKFVKSTWHTDKDNVMRQGLWLKFTTNEYLKHKLLGTGHAILVEHTKNDSYWGDGGDGSGQNMLGRLLMETRTKLVQ